MVIDRFGSTKGLPGLPVISQAVVHGGTVYLCGVTADPVGGITAQTQQVLGRVDELLSRAGTHRSHILTAQVWLRDMALFEEHNEAWNQWVDQDNPPARACVESVLWQPGLLVEIALTAATP